MQMPWNKSCCLLCMAAGVHGRVFEQGTNTAGLALPESKGHWGFQFSVNQGRLLLPKQWHQGGFCSAEGWRMFLPNPNGGFWVGGPPQQDPTSFLEFLSAAAMGDPWVLKGTRNNPWTLAHFSCPCSELGRGCTSHPSSNPAVPIPTTFSFPHLANPWITCYLNEPLPRLLWLLTFLNDES